MGQRIDSSSIPSAWKDDALIDNTIAEAELAQEGACSVRMEKPLLYSYDEVQDAINETCKENFVFAVKGDQNYFGTFTRLGKCEFMDSVFTKLGRE
jgi:hypothetical protein